MFLTWHTLKNTGDGYSIGATYYMDTDYIPVAVRLYAEDAPDIEDAEFNIYKDGVTLFNDRSTKTFRTISGKFEADAETNITLTKGETQEVTADDFTEELLLEEGTFISCNILKDGGGRNFTIQLEIEKVSDE